MQKSGVEPPTLEATSPGKSFGSNSSDRNPASSNLRDNPGGKNPAGMSLGSTPESRSPEGRNFGSTP